MTPLGGGSARPIYNRKTSMPPVGFEPVILTNEKPQTPCLGRRGHGIGFYKSFTLCTTRYERKRKFVPRISCYHYNYCHMGDSMTCTDCIYIYIYMNATRLCFLRRNFLVQIINKQLHFVMFLKLSPFSLLYIKCSWKVLAPNISPLRHSGFYVYHFLQRVTVSYSWVWNCVTSR